MIICQNHPNISAMKTRNILLLILGLAMIQDQTLAANKHYLVESKGKQYLIETQGRTKKGKGAEKVSSSNIYLGLNSTYDTFLPLISFLKDYLTGTNGKTKNGKGVDTSFLFYGKALFN